MKLTPHPRRGADDGILNTYDAMTGKTRVFFRFGGRQYNRMVKARFSSVGPLSPWSAAAQLALLPVA